MSLRRFVLAVCASLLLAAAETPAYAQQTMTNTIVYDVPSKVYCWLQRPQRAPAVAQALPRRPLPGDGEWTCPEEYRWRPEVDFFRAGSVVELVIVNGRFGSTYEPTVNAVAIVTLNPVIRGIDDAEKLKPAAAGEPAEKHAGVDPSLLAPGKISVESLEKSPEQALKDASDLLQKLKALHALALKAADEVRPIIGTVVGPPGLASGIGPGMRLRRLAAFASALDQRTTTEVAAVPAPPSTEYRNERLFQSFVEQTDLLIANVNQLNARMRELAPELASLGPHRDVLNEFLAAANDAATRVERLRQSRNQARERLGAAAAQGEPAQRRLAQDRQAVLEKMEAVLKELDLYLPNMPDGARYAEIRAVHDDINDIPVLSAQINVALPNIFDNINLLYSVSQSTEPFDLLIGQWTANQRVEFKVIEKPGFKRYGFAASISSRQNEKSKEDAATGGGVRVNPEALKDDADTQKTKSGGTEKPKPETGGKPEKPEKKEEAAPEPQKPTESTKPPEPRTLIAHKAFTVHQFARASVTSGFVFSSLRNNEFGIEQVRAVDDEGNPRKTDAGAPIFDRVPVKGESKRPQTHYYAGLLYYFKERDLYPGAAGTNYGVLIGYGLTEQLNFFLGLSTEFKSGISTTIGWHLGREKFLAPGIVTMEDADADHPYTRLADSVTAVPVVTRPAPKGIFGSVGFDLRVFAKVFGGATGTVKD